MGGRGTGGCVGWGVIVGHFGLWLWLWAVDGDGEVNCLVLTRFGRPLQAGIGDAWGCSGSSTFFSSFLTHSLTHASFSINISIRAFTRFSSRDWSSKNGVPQSITHIASDIGRILQDLPR